MILREAKRGKEENLVLQLILVGVVWGLCRPMLGMAGRVAVAKGVEGKASGSDATRLLQPVRIGRDLRQEWIPFRSSVLL